MSYEELDRVRVIERLILADYNRRFARAARSEHDAHRPLQPSDDLARIFSWQETRLVSKSLTVHYKGVLYVPDRGRAACARAEGQHRGAGGRLAELLAW